MKIFTSNDFTGHWPVGAAAVVLAETQEQAVELITARLASLGFEVGWYVGRDRVGSRSRYRVGRRRILMPDSKPPYHLSEFGVETGRREETLWPIRQYTVPVSLGPPTAESQLMYERMNANYAEMANNLGASLYGEDNEFRIVRHLSRFSIIRQRIADAWSVLLGHAEIGDGW